MRAQRATAAEDEYRRLLYVAMTRAADRLVVCGRAANRRCRRAAGTTWWRQALERRIAARSPPMMATGGVALSQDAGAEPATLRRCAGKRRRRLRRCRPGSTRDARPEPRPLRAALAVAAPMTRRVPVRAAGTGADGGRRLRAAWWCTGCCNRCRIVAAARARRGGAAIPAASARTSAPSSDEMAAQVRHVARRSALCRAVRARQPRRGADRRPPRAGRPLIVVSPARSTASSSPPTRC